MNRARFVDPCLLLVAQKHPMYIVLVPEVHAVRIEEGRSVAYLDLWPDLEIQSEGFGTLIIDIRNAIAAVLRLAKKDGSCAQVLIAIIHFT